MRGTASDIAHTATRRGLRTEEVVVPNCQQAHEHWQVLLEWCGAEVFIHLMKTIQHGAEVLWADGNHGRKADCRIHGIAPANPVPETKHVGGIDSELRHFCSIGGDRNKMLCNRTFISSQSRNRPGAS